MYLRENRSKGSITIYVTFVWLIIVCLITTCIENARVQCGAMAMESTLSGCVDAAMTAYYKPLFEQYHVFFMDKGIANEELEQKKIEDSIREYMNAAISTVSYHSADTQAKQGWNLYGTQLEKLKLDSAIRATDYSGGAFYDQVIQYMKYEVAAETISAGLEHLGIMKDCEATASTMEKETGTESKFQEVSRYILKLMEAVEGIRCNRNGIKLDHNGRIGMNVNFAKRICYGDATMEKAGVTNGTVWNSTKNYYYDACKSMEEQKAVCNELIEKIQEEEQWNAMVEAAQREGAQVAATPPPQYDFDGTIHNFHRKQQEERELIRKTKEKIREALNCIDQIERKENGLHEAVASYEEKVEQKRSAVSEEEYNSLKTTAEQMKKDYDVIAGAIRMRGPLERNYAVLEKWESESCSSISKDKNVLSRKIQDIEEVQNTFSQEYRLSDLKFSYGTFTSGEANDPKEHLSALGNSVLDLVTGDGTQISDKCIENGDYYYQKFGEGIDSESVCQAKEKIQNGEDKEFFATIKEVFGGENRLNRMITDASDALLFQEYIKSYFTSYVSSNADSEKALDYELEYIVGGKASDKKNLKIVVDRLLLIRTVTNFSYLLTDQNKMQEAYAAAAALVGFTGIEALIRATQFSILLVWAYEESLVDTAALLDGVKIPLVKTADTFMLSFANIFTLNKGLIRQKVEGLKSKNIRDGVSYDNFLQIFLMFEKKIEKTYRTMDLIENNMKKNESELFSFEKCIYAISVDCEYSIPAKFAALPFMKKWGYADYKWNFCTSVEHSY